MNVPAIVARYQREFAAAVGGGWAFAFWSGHVALHAVPASARRRASAEAGLQQPAEAEWAQCGAGKPG